MMIHYRAAILLCALAALTACAAKQPTHASLRSLHQGSYCGDETAGMRWLTLDVFHNLRGQGVGVHLGTEPPSATDIADDEKLLLLSLGAKGSGGHSLALASSQAEVRDQTIHLPLTIQEPAPGSMQTMQLTYPCLVVGLRGKRYQKVDAGILGSLELDE